MRSKAIFMALLVLAFGAQAVPVSSDQAAAIARAFASRGRPFGRILGNAVERTEQRWTSSGAVYYAVKMVGSGTVITTGDTDQDPIVAFLPGGESLSSLDPKHPLWALLNDDISARQRAVRKLDGASPVYQGAAKLLQAVSANREKWARMTSEDSARLTWGLRLDAVVPPISSWAEIGDLRVDQLLQTKWDQSGHGENALTPKNYVCGCVATAMAQLMRYHCWPTNDVPKFTEQCAVDGNGVSKESKGGVFDWDNMPLKGGSTPEEMAAVGKLTYDCGVAVKMDWGKGGSGAVTADVTDALKAKFGYRNAKLACQYSGLDMSDRNLSKIVFSSLDAGSPVQLGITSSTEPGSGHSVVGDGYGFVDGVSYVHLNMGWSGSGDAWYHFPDIEYHATATGWSYVADTVHTCIYNVFPEQEGLVLAGRALDEEGVPLAEAEIMIERDGVEVAHVTTSELGVWAAILPEATYLVRAVSADGNIFAELESVVLDTDNSWGNDLVLSRPAVRVGDRTFASLNRAIAVAREASESSASPVKIEILEAVPLRVPSTIDFNCVLIATNDDPYASAVRRVNGATLSVDRGTTTLSNVVFETEASTPVFVLADGHVNISGIVVLDDIASGVPGLVAETATGLKLVGRLEAGLTFECRAATEDGAICGRYWCDQGVAEASARLIVSTGGIDRACEAREGDLLWRDNSTVEPEVAVAYVDGDVKVYYRTIERLFDSCTGGTNVVVTKSGIRLQKPRVLRGRQSISAEANAGEIVVWADGTAGFTIGEGCDLTVSGLTFEGYRGNGLFIVNGSDAKLTVTHSVFRDIVGTNKWSGAIAILKGSVLSTGSTAFANCDATGRHMVRMPNGNVLEKNIRSYGGAVYLEGRGCALDLDGGRITNCHAATFGGGIYAAPEASVSVRGTLAVNQNSSGNFASDDICLEQSSSVLMLSGELKGTKSVGVRYVSGGSGRGNAVGDAFAEIADGLNASSVEKSAKAFFNDTKPEMVMAVADAGLLRWAADDHQVDPDDPRVTIRVTKGAVSACYIEPEHAFGWIGANDVAKVEVLKSAAFGADLVVTNGARVTLVSTNGLPSALTRSDAFQVRVLTGAALVMTNVVLDGAGPAVDIGLVQVEGGELELQTGAIVKNVVGSANRVSGAIAVRNHGTFTMRSGAEIVDCSNGYFNPGTEASYGGGLLVEDHSTANLLGGRIAECSAYHGGGVFIGTESVVSISGDMEIEDNFEKTWGRPDNLCVADQSSLVLANDFIGSIGCNEGYLGDDNVFGKVDADYYRAASFESLTNAAVRFSHDWRDVRGVVATNGTDEALLVWFDAFVEEDGVWTFAFADPVTKEVRKYGALGAIPPPAPVPPPQPPHWEVVTTNPTQIAFKSIDRVSDTEWALVITDRVEFCNYRLLWTDDLTKGFTSTGAWEHAVEDAASPEWKTNVITTGGAWFWRAEGKDGTNMVLKTEE